MDQQRLRIEQLDEPFQLAEVRGGVHVHLRAARDQVLRCGVRRTVQNAEAARLPMAPRVDVRAEVEQHVDELEAWILGQADCVIGHQNLLSKTARRPQRRPKEGDRCVLL